MHPTSILDNKTIVAHHKYLERKEEELRSLKRQQRRVKRKQKRELRRKG